MADNELTQEVKEFALKEIGADLVGIADVERFAGAPPGHRPGELLPGARSVIVMAARALDSTFLSTNPRVFVQR